MGVLANVKFQKYCLWVVLAVPLVVLTSSLFVNPSPDPYERIAHVTGEWALRLLVLTLLITPLKDLTGIKRLGAFRRSTGVACFAYVLAHAFAYMVFEAEFQPSFLLQDAPERPFIFGGLIAFTLLVPLAVTSNNFFVGKLGRNWKKLHRLVFPIAIIATIHMLMAHRGEHLAGPLTYAAIFALLLGYRAFVRLRGSRAARPAS